MISAIVLAAGLSQRMGSFKLLLPWGDATVIEQVVATLALAGLPDIVVVTGYRSPELVHALAGTPVRFVLNANYSRGDMLGSLQVALTELQSSSGVPAALLCLGDQPQVEVATVQAILAAGAASGWQKVVIPSYQMRAGHPVLLPRSLWPAIMTGSTHLRAIMDEQKIRPVYLTVDTPTILADLDTPEDYQRAQSPLGK